jgi:hypothetical protein
MHDGPSAIKRLKSAMEGTEASSMPLHYWANRKT